MWHAIGDFIVSFLYRISKGVCMGDYGLLDELATFLKVSMIFHAVLVLFMTI